MAGGSEDGEPVDRRDRPGVLLQGLGLAARLRLKAQPASQFTGQQNTDEQVAIGTDSRNLLRSVGVARPGHVIVDEDHDCGPDREAPDSTG